MADSSEPAFLFLYRKEAVAPLDYLSTFATAPSMLMHPHDLPCKNMCFNYSQLKFSLPAPISKWYFTIPVLIWDIG